MAQIQQRRGALTTKVIISIKDRVADGRLVPGQYLPSERMLADDLGVSRVTVRRGLDALVQERLLTRIACKGYALNDSVVDPLMALPRKTIVFVHSHPEETFQGERRHAQILSGVKEEAVKSDLMLLVSSITEEELTPSRAQELAKVAGGVLCDHSDKAYLRTLVDAGIPVVQVDYHRYPDLPVDAIVQDDAGGIALAVNYLHSHGHRRIGYVDTTQRYRAAGHGLNAEQRLAGFKASTTDLGISRECVIQQVTGSESEALQLFLDQGVTALVFPHIDFWPGFQRELQCRDIAFPSDFGVVAWGLERVPGDKTICPTSITWSGEQMGREGVRRLLYRLQGDTAEPATIVIPCRLENKGTGGFCAAVPERETIKA